MEANDSFTLPPELWSHILTYIDLDDIIKLRPVCKIFNHELKNRNPLDGIKDVKWNKDVISKFRSRRGPHLTEAQIVKYLSRGNGKNIIERDGEHFYCFKAILVGPLHTGKSTLWASYKEGRFTEHNYIGADFLINTSYDLGVQTKLQLWDTAGAERFRSYHPAGYYRGASGVLFCFNITDRMSFVDLLNICLAPTIQVLEPNVICYLVGTKSDLEASRAVSKMEAETVAQVFKMKYFEVSAKEFKNINEMVNSLRIDMLRAMTDFDVADAVPSKSDRRCNVM